MEILTDITKLSDRCDEIDIKSEKAIKQEIITNLKKEVRNRNLNGLSAPALGYNKRIFVLNYKDLEPKTYINPIITESEGLQLSEETCTSIPNKTYLVPRSSKITVMYQDPMGRIQSRQLLGKAAFQFQHEYAHLDGILISDIGLEIDDDFKNASDDEKAEVIKWYLDSLDIGIKELNKELEEDEESKKILDAVKFITSVQKGETEVEFIKENDIGDKDNKAQENG